MLFLEQIADDRRLLLSAVPVAAHGLSHFTFAGRQALVQRISLDILIEQLVRIEFGAVARQQDQAQLLRVGLHKPLDEAGLVNRMAVHDQTYLALDLFEQPVQKLNEQRCPEFSLKDHEGQDTFVGDGRDHVAAKALSGGPDHERLSRRGVALAADVIAASPGQVCIHRFSSILNALPHYLVRMSVKRGNDPARIRKHRL